MVNSYRIIGIMSGTSMDGVDLAYASYSRSGEDSWSHEVHAVKTYSYPGSLLMALKDSVFFPAERLCIFDKDLGRFFGEMVNKFITEFAIPKAEIDAIASHGHTIFHQPKNGFTLQIGCGTTLASLTGIKVINDFRAKDVINGGQGAPLVPIGDTLLFGALADAFLNIGGFANICVNKDPILAFDIGPGNLPLNEICERHYNRAYDHNGELARSGTIIPHLLSILNDLDYYTEVAPKSLGTEWLEQYFRPLTDFFSEEKPEDLLQSITVHLAQQISNSLNQNHCKTVLITGGGAKNGYLIELIKRDFEGEVLIPSDELIDFKEAIVFGFLGALYLAGRPNTIPSVTGAKKAVSAGVLHTP